jgi:four helix bundle protein
VGEKIKTVRDLIVYQQAFECAMEIFRVTSRFPAVEKYSLTDQIRRSSRSVCSSLAEAWRKRKYIKAFTSKLCDAMQEAAETQTWLEFAKACEYISPDEFKQLDDRYEEILKMLNSMEMKSDKFCF